MTLGRCPLRIFCSRGTPEKYPLNLRAKAGFGIFDRLSKQEGAAPSHGRGECCFGLQVGRARSDARLQLAERQVRLRRLLARQRTGIPFDALAIAIARSALKLSYEWHKLTIWYQNVVPNRQLLTFLVISGTKSSTFDQVSSCCRYTIRRCRHRDRTCRTSPLTPDS